MTMLLSFGYAKYRPSHFHQPAQHTMLRLITYIFIATTLSLTQTAQVHLAKPPLPDILTVSPQGGMPIKPKEPLPLLSGSFVLVTQLQSIYVAPPTPTVTTIGCGSDPYQILIYTRESGCSTTATNSGGCYGLGQDCDNVVRNLCGADWTCQNNYFTSYMQARYGSWAAGWQHELSYGWW